MCAVNLVLVSVQNKNSYLVFSLFVLARFSLFAALVTRYIYGYVDVTFLPVI